MERAEPEAVREEQDSRFPEPGNSLRLFRIIIPYSSPDVIRENLKSAALMAGSLPALIIILVVQIVPFDQPLDEPGIFSDPIVNQLDELARGSTLPVHVEWISTRSRSAAIADVLEAGSLALLAFGERWWLTEEARLAMALVRDGCSVSLLIMGPDEVGFLHNGGAPRRPAALGSIGSDHA